MFGDTKKHSIRLNSISLKMDFAGNGCIDEKEFKIPSSVLRIRIIVHRPLRD